MSEISRNVVRGGCLGSVLGGVLGAFLAGGLATLITFALAQEDPGPQLFPFLHPSRGDAAAMMGFLVAFPGAFVGAIVGAIRGARNAVSGFSAETSESSEEELVRLRKQVQELEEKTRSEAIQRKGTTS